MEADGVGGGAPSRSPIVIRGLDGPHPDMAGRPRDLGFCHLLADARDSKGDISLVGRNAFGAWEESPRAERIIIFSEGLAEELERRLGGRH